MQNNIINKDAEEFASLLIKWYLKQKVKEEKKGVVNTQIDDAYAKRS